MSSSDNTQVYWRHLGNNHYQFLDSSTTFPIVTRKPTKYHNGKSFFIYYMRHITVYHTSKLAECSKLKAILQVLIYKALYDKSYLGSKTTMTSGEWTLLWFHLQRLRWPVRNGKGAKNSKWKYMSPAGFEPTPRQSTTGKLQRLRPLGHAG